MPPIIRKNIAALGLKRRNQVVYQTISAATAIKLSKVKELIKVELVEERQTPQEINQDRKFKPGFEIEKGENRVTNSLFTSTFAICVLLVGANSVLPCPVDSVHGNESVIDERLKRQQQKLNEDKTI
ncbi:hypothetical protein DFJ63DRAFT_335575 [Scheffersomyces coipomensis]|uniref:uncharacterized protein n=1 Tax=Scheffersomyces coipomensis TaxID=1788519 RepID=UPI00315D9E77